MKNLTIFKFDPTTPSTLPHVSTRRNGVAKRNQHVAPKSVAIVWPGLKTENIAGPCIAEDTKIMRTVISESRTPELSPHRTASSIFNIPDLPRSYTTVSTN